MHSILCSRDLIAHLLLLLLQSMCFHDVSTSLPSVDTTNDKLIQKIWEEEERVLLPWMKISLMYGFSTSEMDQELIAEDNRIYCTDSMESTQTESHFQFRVPRLLDFILSQIEGIGQVAAQQLYNPTVCVRWVRKVGRTMTLKMILREYFTAIHTALNNFNNNIEASKARGQGHYDNIFLTAHKEILKYVGGHIYLPCVMRLWFSDADFKTMISPRIPKSDADYSKKKCIIGARTRILMHVIFVNHPEHKDFLPARSRELVTYDGSVNQNSEELPFFDHIANDKPFEWPEIKKATLPLRFFRLARCVLKLLGKLLEHAIDF